MSKVIEIHRRGTFSVEEAQQLIPILNRMTQNYVQVVERIMTQLESLSSENFERIAELESKINKDIAAWHSKVKKLGGIPKGLWIVNLDSGNGYFSWQHGETQLMYWQNYSQSFKERQPLHQMPKLENLDKEKSVVEDDSVVSPLL